MAAAARHVIAVNLSTLSEPMYQYVFNSFGVQENSSIDHISIGSWQSGTNSLTAELIELESRVVGSSLGVIFRPELCGIFIEGCIPIGSIGERKIVVISKEEMDIADFQFTRNAILLRKDIHLKSELKFYNSQIEGRKPIKNTLKELALCLHFGYEIVPCDTTTKCSLLLRKADVLTSDQTTDINNMTGFFNDETVRSEILRIPQLSALFKSEVPTMHFSSIGRGPRDFAAVATPDHSHTDSATSSTKVKFRR